jgi:transcriptional regulator with XRE-family HTH domain
MTNLSERLKQLRTEQSLTQTELANAMSLSLRGYQYYERGEREPNASQLIQLADYFQVSLDYLVGRSDER